MADTDTGISLEDRKRTLSEPREPASDSLARIADALEKSNEIHRIGYLLGARDVHGDDWRYATVQRLLDMEPDTKPEP